MSAKDRFEASILQWVGETALQRGKRYAREGRVLHPRRQGNVLKALCQGQAIEPYRVWVRLEGEEILRARCTCPVGSEGKCKHVAALLMQWHTHPETFAPAPPLTAVLEKWEKQALIRLILQMIERDPDLAEFVWIAASKRPQPPSGRDEQPE